jgi:hypothetical protein
MNWPDRRQHKGSDEEARLFFTWLFLNYHDRPEVMELESDDMLDNFLDKHKNVLWPESKEEEKWSNLRLEPRIPNDVVVVITVTECSDPGLVGVTVTGRTLDVGLHGLRAVVDTKILQPSVISVKIKKETEGAREYQLAGELRWVTDLETGYLIGIELNESEGFPEWRDDFGAEFVAPVLGRSPKS